MKPYPRWWHWRSIKALLVGMPGCLSPDPAVQRARVERIRKVLEG